MPDPLQHARLTLEADPDGDGNTETGVFVLAGNLEVTPSIRTGFVGRGGDQINAVFKTLIDEYGGDSGTNLGPENRKGAALDVGGGEQAIDVQFRGWDGAKDSDGNYLQWGNDPTQTVTQASATGALAETQIEVLMRYITTGTFDSRSPATLEYGQHYDGGLYEPQDVIFEGPEATTSFEDPTSFSGRMTLIAVQDVSGYLDALQRGKR